MQYTNYEQWKAKEKEEECITEQHIVTREFIREKRREAEHSRNCGLE